MVALGDGSPQPCRLTLVDLLGIDQGRAQPTLPTFPCAGSEGMLLSHLHTQPWLRLSLFFLQLLPGMGPRGMTRPEPLPKLLSHPVLSVSILQTVAAAYSQDRRFPLSPPITLVQPAPFLTWTITMGFQTGPASRQPGAQLRLPLWRSAKQARGGKEQRIG